MGTDTIAVSIFRLSTIVHEAPPIGDVFDDRLLERSVLVASEQRQKRFERRATIAEEVDLHWVSEAEHPAGAVNLHASGLTDGWKEVGVRK